MSYSPWRVCCISQSWEKPLEHPFCCSKLTAVTHLAGTGRTCMSKGGGSLSWRQGYPWPNRCLDFPGQIWRGVPGAGTAAVPDVPEGHQLLRVGAVDGRARRGGWGLWVPGAGESVSAMVVTWNQTWGGSVELAWALALAQCSKQATRDVQAQLCGRSWGAVGPASSWQDCLVAPSCLQRPECPIACVPLWTLGQSFCTPSPSQGCRGTPGLISVLSWGSW